MEMQQELRIRTLEAEAATEELDAARAALAEHAEAHAKRQSDADEVGAFLLACMEDVKQKVVEVERVERPDDCDSIVVLPGVLQTLEQSTEAMKTRSESASYMVTWRCGRTSYCQKFRRLEQM